MYNYIGRFIYKINREEFDRMEKALKIKQIVVVLIAIAAVAIGYYMFQSITSPAKAVAKQENVVQLASEQPKVEMNKTAPSRFNGKERKVAYLTFDDGPGKYTAELLNTLKQHDAKATFFFNWSECKRIS